MVTHTKGYNLAVAANGVSMSYNDIGEGGVPVIFLHGFPFDKTMWQLQLDFLKSNHRVIALDIRGFGKSKDEETPAQIDLFGNDLIAFMDALHIKNAIVCGLSMGGFIALNAISRFSNRFEALVLCDTQCIADTPKEKEHRYNTVKQIEEKGATAFNDRFMGMVFHQNTLNTKKELVKIIHNVVFANTNHIIKSGLMALADRKETCSALSQIAAPTLIICGRQDLVTPLKESEWMHSKIHGSTLHIIENAGHLSNLEHPDTFNKLLGDFLSGLQITPNESLAVEVLLASPDRLNQ
jgi:3-oxoadipate enol-lactonase